MAKGKDIFADHCVNISVVPNNPYPTVSVIIPCWNAESWIAEAIQSALDQNYPDLEIIVVDDGSSDHSLDVIKTFSSKIRWQTGPNCGGGSARNKGIQLATSQYLCFLDADDFFCGPHIAALASQTNQNEDMVIGCERIHWQGGRLTKKLLPFNSDTRPDDYLSLWLEGVNAQTSSVLWKRSFLEKIGGWNEAIPKFQDMDLAFRGFLAAPKIAVSQRCGVAYRLHDSPNRVSQRRDRKTFEFLLRYLRDLSNDFESKSKTLKIALGKRSYQFAMSAFHSDFPDIGDAFLSLSWENGFRGHLGTFKHVAASYVLGCHLKMQIAKWIKMIVHN